MLSLHVYISAALISSLIAMVCAIKRIVGTNCYLPTNFYVISFFGLVLLFSWHDPPINLYFNRLYVGCSHYLTLNYYVLLERVLVAVHWNWCYYFGGFGCHGWSFFLCPWSAGGVHFVASGSGWFLSWPDSRLRCDSVTWVMSLCLSGSRPFSFSSKLSLPLSLSF